MFILEIIFEFAAHIVLEVLAEALLIGNHRVEVKATTPHLKLWVKGRRLGRAVAISTALVAIIGVSILLAVA